MLLRDFQHDPGLRASFEILAGQVFGIGFEDWYRGGFWDGTYSCRAWVEEGRVLATVGVSDMRLTLDGQPLRATQIGTVMTHPEHRGRGLSTRLLEDALAGRDPVFLFANPDAADFYPRFGFRRVPCWSFRLAPDGTHAAPVPSRPLDPGKAADAALLRELCERRAPLSRRLSVQAPNLLMWWALGPLRGNLRLVPEEGLAYAGRREGAAFHLYDVIAPRLPDWERLRACLDLEGAEAVVFHFTPDLVAPDAEARPDEEELLFVRGELPFGETPFRYPCTAMA